MNKKRILTIFAAVLMAALCLWRLWPRSFTNILDVDADAFRTISVHVSEFGITDNSPTIDVYRLDLPSPDADGYAAVLSILQDTSFRPDFRNLLPWDILTVGSGTKNITHSANVMLTWGDGDDSCYLSFHGDRIVSFDIRGNTGYLIYHPTNRAVLTALAEYAKANGEFLT